MLRNTETVLFFVATVAALALPAVPALQEARTGEGAQRRPGQASRAAAPVVVPETIRVAPNVHASPEQVAVVR